MSVLRDLKLFLQRNKTWIFNGTLFQSTLYQKASLLLFKLINISANENYFKYYSSPFRMFHRFSFNSTVCLWLIPQPDKFFVFTFVYKKEDAFQKKNEQLSRSRCRYFFSFSIGSHFQEICISLLPNIFYVSYIDLITRADNCFISSKQFRAVLKTYLFYKKAFYNVKCSYFALTLPWILGGWWNLCKSLIMMGSF